MTARLRLNVPSCSKIRHVIATFIYAIITLPKHSFESHTYVNMHALLLM